MNTKMVVNTNINDVSYIIKHEWLKKESNYFVTCA